MLINRTFCVALSRNARSLVLPQASTTPFTASDTVHYAVTTDTAMSDADIRSKVRPAGTDVKDGVCTMTRVMTNAKDRIVFTPGLKIKKNQTILNFVILGTITNSGKNNVYIEITRDELVQAGLKLDAQNVTVSEFTLKYVEHEFWQPY